MAEITFKNPGRAEEPESKAAGKMFVQKEGKWEPAAWDKVLDVPLKQIIEGELRFILELTIERQQMFLVSHSEDEQDLHAKYPNKSIVNIKALYKFLRKSSEDPAWLELLPRVFVFLNTFPSSKVVK